MNGNPTHTTITQGNPTASTPPPGIDPAQWALFQAFQAFQVIQQQQPTQQQQHSDQDDLDNEQSDDDPYMYLVFLNLQIESNMSLIRI